MAITSTFTALSTSAGHAYSIHNNVYGLTEHANIGRQPQKRHRRVRVARALARCARVANAPTQHHVRNPYQWHHRRRISAHRRPKHSICITCATGVERHRYDSWRSSEEVARSHARRLGGLASTPKTIIGAIGSVAACVQAMLAWCAAGGEDRAFSRRLVLSNASSERLRSFSRHWHAASCSAGFGSAPVAVEGRGVADAFDRG